MPIYEYQCELCGTVRDIKHGFKETTSETCEKCGGPLKRLFSPAGIVFKGSGFYLTDSRKAAAATAEAASKSSSGSKSDSGAAKSESSGGS